MSDIQSFIDELKRDFSGGIRTDRTSRILFSTDASNYQIAPIGVAFPRIEDDLVAAVSLAAHHNVPILARGAGSSLAGQAIGAALILDCSRYLDKIIAIQPEEKTAVLEPGVVLNTLNQAAGRYGLQFGPDPASAERATIGGSIANNASGAHSIVYGMAAEHLVAADVVLANGEAVTLNGSANPTNSSQSNIEQQLAKVRVDYADPFRTNWPKVWRNASGYHLPPLFNSSPNLPTANSPIPPSLLAGSEGTLAVIRQLTVRLVPRPKYTILGVLAYPNIASACDAVPGLLEHHPTAVELIPYNLIRLSRTVPVAAHRLGWLSDLPPQPDGFALLVVEFAGDDKEHLRQQARQLRDDVLLAESAQAQDQVWAVRKLGLGILQSQPGRNKLVTFIEDMSVPVEKLGYFVREMDRIMAEYGSHGDFYAHASAGCLHMRPVLDIGLADWPVKMRAIAESAADLVASLGGTMSGEHGDGLARSEWLARIYGPEILAAFRAVKTAFDPKGILNPGKIVNPGEDTPLPPMDVNLRARANPANLTWQPVMDFTHSGGASGAEGFVGAIEMCNGAGVCRKFEGTMCPSFQATRDEMHSTRGRANLLRAMLSDTSLVQDEAEVTAAREAAAQEATAYKSLDLCLACKGCKADCPSAVDMAKLKYEFMNAYYTHHRRKLRDYLFGYIGTIAPLGAAFNPIVNWVLRNPPIRRMMESFFGLSCQRPFPSFQRRMDKPTGQASSGSTVLFLADTFNRYFYPETERAARKVLSALDIQVIDVPVLGAGRTLISKGFLEPARKHAFRLLEAIYQCDSSGELPVVGLEPSEIYTLRDEFLDFFPNDKRAQSLASRAWLIDEFLIRQPRYKEYFETRSDPSHTKIMFHGHCYQKAQPPAGDGIPVGVPATVSLLKTAGFDVNVIDDGCCGMAGAFGYEQEHYDLSIRVGELALFPAVRANPDVKLAAAGVSCQAQVEDGTGRAALHPIRWVADLFD